MDVPDSWRLRELGGENANLSGDRRLPDERTIVQEHRRQFKTGLPRAYSVANATLVTTCPAVNLKRQG